MQSTFKQRGDQNLTTPHTVRTSASTCSSAFGAQQVTGTLCKVPHPLLLSHSKAIPASPKVPALLTSRRFHPTVPYGTVLSFYFPCQQQGHLSAWLSKPSCSGEEETHSSWMMIGVANKKKIKCQQQQQNKRWGRVWERGLLENVRKINRAEAPFLCQQHSGVIWSSYLCHISRTMLEKKWLNTASVSSRHLIVAVGSPLGGFDKGNMSW